MAKMYFDEAGLREILERVTSALPEESLSGDIEKLQAGIGLGLGGYHVIMSIRPLIQSVWVSFCTEDNPQRFVVERILREIDDYLSSWIVPDKGSEDETEEG